MMSAQSPKAPFQWPRLESSALDFFITLSTVGKAACWSLADGAGQLFHGLMESC